MKKEQETYARRSNVGAPGVMERAAVGRIRSFRVQDQIVKGFARVPPTPFQEECSMCN